MKTKFFLVIFFLLFFWSGSNNTFAQSANDTVIFNTLGKFDFNFTYSGYTPLIDRLGRPYVYLATKELGLVTFDVSNTMNPVPVDSQTVVSLGNLKVTGLAQDSIYLLVSLGDFQGSGQNAGLAIFDVSNPVVPVLLDRWDTTAFNTGVATVIQQGNYAYLGAMSAGVVILNIANKQDIQFVSQIIPDTTFGNQTHVYHARGLFLNGDTLLVANDNGGLRAIDVTDKQNPVEIGKYINNTMSAVADPFYNHVYRVGNYAYCAMDYCGFEVVDVTTPSLMAEASWLDPWNCTKLPPPFGSWNGSDGHTNEIAYSSSQNVLFFSGGDSEVLALDPSNPLQPRIMGSWGVANDSIGTWGVDVFGNLVALANIRTFGFPFVSTVGGLQLLNWNLMLGVEDNDQKEMTLNIFPNPAAEKFTLELPVLGKTNYSLELMDVFGRMVLKEEIKSKKSEIQTDKLQNGIYLVRLIQDGKTITTDKIIITN